MKLNDLEEIIGAWCANNSGPGWSNRTVYVVVTDPYGKIKLYVIQGNEMTDEMRCLFPMLAAGTEQLVSAAKYIDEAARWPSNA